MMRTDVDRADVVAREQATYDAGPSGTAVAGLIVGLLALAIALYAAFAPRQIVREGADAVTASWQQAAGSEQQQPVQQHSAQSRQPSQTQPSETQLLREEFRKEFSSVKSELSDLRQQIADLGSSRGRESASGGQPKNQ